MARRRDEAGVLAASEAGARLIIERGGLDVTVRELAERAGIPQRTFYRWFATKEQVLLPVFTWGTDEFARTLEESGDSLPAAMDDAFDRILWGELEARTRGLFPIVFADPLAWALFLKVVHDGEERVAAALERRVGLVPGTPASRVAAAAVSSAVRLALETLVLTGDDPRPVFHDLIAASAIAAESSRRDT